MLQQVQSLCLVTSFEFGIINRQSKISKRNVRITLSHHALYALGIEEDSEDNIKSSCPYALGRRMRYNGRDKSSQSYEGELIAKSDSQFGL